MGRGMSNVIYEKSLSVCQSALDRGMGYEMAENHLFAAIAALADSPEEQGHLRRRLVELQDARHSQLCDDGLGE